MLFTCIKGTDNLEINIHVCNTNHNRQYISQYKTMIPAIMVGVSMFLSVEYYGDRLARSGRGDQPKQIYAFRTWSKFVSIFLSSSAKELRVLAPRTTVFSHNRIHGLCVDFGNWLEEKTSEVALRTSNRPRELSLRTPSRPRELSPRTPSRPENCLWGLRVNPENYLLGLRVDPENIKISSSVD